MFAKVCWTFTPFTLCLLKDLTKIYSICNKRQKITTLETLKLCIDFIAIFMFNIFLRNRDHVVNVHPVRYPKTSGFKNVQVNRLSPYSLWLSCTHTGTLSMLSVSSYCNPNKVKVSTAAHNERLSSSITSVHTDFH